MILNMVLLYLLSVSSEGINANSASDTNNSCVEIHISTNSIFDMESVYVSVFKFL